MSDFLLKVRVQHSFGPGTAVDLNFAATQPWTVLFGPSGAGKSTILRAIAGLIEPQAGRVVLNGTALTDTAQNVFVPPHQRSIGFVGQRSVLFPHLTVEENVRFGVRNLPEGAARARVMLETFEASALSRRPVQDLSGGETQRVLLARALVTAPRLLLLDEAFAGMDMGLRASLVVRVKELDVPVISVTHDVSEVFALGADVIVLDAGRVQDQGEASVVLGEQREMLLRTLG